MRKDLVLIAIIVATLTLMVVPLNQAIIDVLLAINISLSVLMLMVAVYLRHPSDFSTFPSVILIGTAFRLALSVGTTRLILSEADAGTIIQTFGDFVVSGSIAIGMVIFLIITVVQFLVVTKGAERVAEVGARFALDALPGKQMSIDAEVRAGNLDPEEGAILRKRLDKDSQFFGAMDGAMKFVKGDAIAGLIIISINLIGGIAVGISLHGYGFGEAVGVFSLLTVGDGLVAQIPALLMSLCAGVIVTRVANQENDDLGTDIAGELVSDPRVPSVAALIVLAIGFIPGFPTFVFAGIALLLIIIAAGLRRAKRVALATAEAETLAAEQAVAQENDRIADNSGLELPLSDRFKLLLGTEISKELSRSELEHEIATHFQALFAARGVRFPRASIEASPFLAAREVVIELDEVPIFRSTLPKDRVLISKQQTEDVAVSLESSDVTPFASPVLNGLWVARSDLSRVEAMDLETMSSEEVLAYVAFRFYEQNLGPLFSISVFQDLLEQARATEPATLQLIEAEMSEAALYKMFRYLVEDGVPMRPLSLLVSSLHYWIHSLTKPTSVTLAECLRGSMKRQLCHRIAGSHGILGIALLDPALEELALRNLAEMRQPSENAANDGLVFDNEVTDDLLAQFRDLLEPLTRGGRQVAVVASAPLRRRLRNFLATNNLHIAVLAPHEVASEVPSHPLELIKLPAEAIAAAAKTPSKPPQKRRQRAAATA